MKEKKVQEFKNKINDDINNFNIMDELDKKERKKKTRDSSIKKLINTMTENEINNIEINNEVNYNFKKKEYNKDIKEQIGIKKYEDDYDEKDLINLYDKKELKDNLFHISYNKKKLYKMKLLKEKMNNDNKDGDN